MKKIILFIIGYSGMLFISLFLQLCAEELINYTLYDFENYELVGWAFQIIYWMLSISFSIYAGIEISELED